MKKLFTLGAMDAQAQHRFVTAFFDSQSDPSAIEEIIMRGGVNPETFGEAAPHLRHAPLEVMLRYRAYLREGPKEQFDANVRIARCLILESKESLVTCNEYGLRMADRVASDDVFSREIAAEVVIATVNNDLLAARKPYEPNFDAIFWKLGDAENPFHLTRQKYMQNMEDTHTIVMERIENPKNAYDENLARNKDAVTFWALPFSPPALDALPMPSQDFIDGARAFGAMSCRIWEEFCFSEPGKILVVPEERFFNAADDIRRELGRIIRRKGRELRR